MVAIIRMSAPSPDLPPSPRLWSEGHCARPQAEHDVDKCQSRHASNLRAHETSKQVQRNGVQRDSNTQQTSGAVKGLYQPCPPTCSHVLSARVAADGSQKMSAVRISFSDTKTLLPKRACDRVIGWTLVTSEPARTCRGPGGRNVTAAETRTSAANTQKFGSDGNNKNQSE